MRPTTKHYTRHVGEGLTCHITVIVRPHFDVPDIPTTCCRVELPWFPHWPCGRSRREWWVGDSIRQARRWAEQTIALYQAISRDDSEPPY